MPEQGPQPESKFSNPNLAKILADAKAEAAARPLPGRTKTSQEIDDVGERSVFKADDNSVKTIPPETDLQAIAKIKQPDLRTREVVRSDPASVENVVKMQANTRSNQPQPSESGTPETTAPNSQPESAEADKSQAA